MTLRRDGGLSNERQLASAARDEAVLAQTITQGVRDETKDLRNETEDLRDETEGLRDETEATKNLTENLYSQTADAVQEALDAETAIEARMALIEEIAGAAIFATWDELDAETGMVAGDAAVIFEDAGTHTDPVLSATVNNTGLYKYRHPDGWERIADASEAARQAVRAEAAADEMADAVARVPPVYAALPTIAFTDADGRMLGEFDQQGRLALQKEANETAKAAVNYLQSSPDMELLFGVVDAENKVVFGVMTDGQLITMSQSVAAQSSDPVMPYGGSLSVASMSDATLTDIATVAVGRADSDGNSPPTLSLDGAGFTHPSVVCIPGGWNGYPYWMAVTPYFGPVGSQSEYENPTIFCSLDGVNWIEPAGISNPLDFPNNDPDLDYWSDTHLVLGDDGRLHMFYRGNGTSRGGRCITHRSSRDGVSWTAPVNLWTSDGLTSVGSDNLLLSPAFVKYGARWTCFDVVSSSAAAGSLEISSRGNQTSRFVMRRDALEPEGPWGEYSTDQVVNFTNRPWGAGNDPWHINVERVGNLFLMLVSSGPVGSSTSTGLWLAWSVDGWNFTVVTTALFASATYRSALVVESADANTINCRLYRARTDNGRIDHHDLTLEISA